MAPTFYRNRGDAGSGENGPPGPETLDLTVPGSKSATMRALVAAAFAGGTSRLDRALDCDDSDVLRASLEALGARIRKGSCWQVEGTLAVPPGPLALAAGESGAALRFLLALAAAGRGRYAITVSGRLGARPIDDLRAALEGLGATVDGAGDPGYAVSTPGLSGGELRLAGVRSSQTVSALLLMAPLLASGLRIRVPPRIPSGGYVELTIQTMDRFGVAVVRKEGELEVPPGSRYRAADVAIEGDWSSASYLLVGAAIAGRAIRLAGLEGVTSQPDRAVLALLEQAGIEVGLVGDRVTARGWPRHPFRAEFDSCPDLAPAAAALAAAIPGTSVLSGVERLRDKESDRLAALVSGLTAAGVAAESAGGSLIVEGGRRPRPVRIDARRDHRMVMSFALLSLLEPGLEVSDHAAVSKSYPGFFEALARLRRAR